VADATLEGGQAPQQILLTRKGTEALVHVEHLLDDASRALAVQATPGGTLSAIGGRQGGAHTVTAASDQQPAGISRGD
jgi:hypothetical protein